ncbi:winged helix-turn-helix domain-containing protein [Chromobacterium vaccinii]|uniref:winged helix-turn-helix domain-containing protein n=1 Tax=Chromobacterium vaccinii TaxID=1108595 RepID=UPI003C7288EA
MDYRLGEGRVSFFYDQGVLKSINGVSIELRRAECELLHCLLSGVTDKKGIISAVWPNTVVGNGSYNKTIFDLRSQLKQVGLDASLIKTVPRKACHYIGHVEPIGLSGEAEARKYPVSALEKSNTPNLKKTNRLSCIALVVSSCALGIVASIFSNSPYHALAQKNDGGNISVYTEGALSVMDIESLTRVRTASRIYAYAENERVVFFICSKNYEALKCTNQEKLQ